MHGDGGLARAGIPGTVPGSARLQRRRRHPACRVALLASSLTTSPLLIAAVTAAQYLAWLTFGPFGGALVDRCRPSPDHPRDSAVARPPDGRTRAARLGRPCSRSGTCASSVSRSPSARFWSIPRRWRSCRRSSTVAISTGPTGGSRVSRSSPTISQERPQVRSCSPSLPGCRS